MANNILADKSFAFSIRIVNLYKYLNKSKTNSSLANQILRSGTSVGASITESIYAASKKDFINKLTVSLKEANETRYWLRLFFATTIITEKMFTSLNKDCEEIIKILTSSINTAKTKKI
jgi:four helix bundle protein